MPSSYHLHRLYLHNMKKRAARCTKVPAYASPGRGPAIWCVHKKPNVSQIPLDIT